MVKRNWAQRLIACADLSGEVHPGMPVVEILGDHRVLIERHNGVTQYSDQKIGIKISYGHIHITGSGLELANMTREQLVITGRIDSLILERGERR